MKRPKPVPPPRKSAPAPGRSIEAHLRGALAHYDRRSSPEAVQAALESAGLRLSLEAVQFWLSQLHDEGNTP
ncbi:hypothetical protein JOF28_000544 [Leucobacter exalbidus]|uniref:Uncharacterized protein n=1 Tax=Leucobacter exalbidus TaxID=662960 RepID=A0A940PJZ6_9MICO|nr:hypothetical protein [Leucobacter exalbidus]MBP1325312.1 hypothetical protein [Leucobacter exalbidus]